MLVRVLVLALRGVGVGAQVVSGSEEEKSEEEESGEDRPAVLRVIYTPVPCEAPQGPRD